MKRPDQILLIALSIVSIVQCAAAETSTTKTPLELQDRSLAELRRAFAEESMFVKVHAAEALLSLGYDEDVVSTFESELEQHGDEPGYRIGIWRVLARALPARDRAPYLQKLIDAGLDRNGADQVDAIESLAKLRQEISVEDRRAFAEEIQALPGNGIPYCRWLLANDNTDQEVPLLCQLLESPHAEVRGLTAYCLRHLHSKLPPEVADKLAEAADRETSSPHRCYLQSAAFVTAVESARVESFKAGVIKELGIGNRNVRYEACSALGVRGDHSDLPVLGAALGDVDADVRVAAALAILRIGRRVPHSFAALDWIVVVVYGAGMLFAGWWYSRSSNVEDYLLGGRAMNPLAVGISLYATLMSTLTYLALPGEMISHGPMILAGVLSYPLVYLVVGQLMIPFIMKIRVISAYEILERRFGLSVRLAGSSIFLGLRLLWMSLIVFATADVVLVPLMGLDESVTPWVCVVMALVTIIYTSMGGLQAVVFIDVLQTTIMLLGAVLSLAIITYSVGGVDAWWPSTWSLHWDEPSWFFAPGSRVSVGMMILSSFAWYTCTAGSDQMAIQRYLATRDAPTARRMFGYSLCCDLFVTSLLASLGLALFAYFRLHPEMLPDGYSIYENADQLLPQFIVRVLPAGIAGLVVAGILSAAMDSLSSGLNSASSVITEDWLDRFRRNKLQPSGELRQAKLVSWFVGLIVIILSLLAGYLTGNLVEQCYTFVNLLTTPLFILFFMAMFVPWATTFGTWAALAATLAISAGIAYFEWFGLSFVWIMPVSLMAGVATGCIASLLPIGKRRPMLEMES